MVERKLTDKLSESLEINKSAIKTLCADSIDIVFSPVDIGGNRSYLLWCDGMIDKQKNWEQIFRQLRDIGKWRYRGRPRQLKAHLCERDALLIDHSVCDTYELLLERIMSGFTAILIEGLSEAVVVGLQGFNFRSVSESYTEENVRASREGFVEPLHINMTLIRRRLKSNLLVFETTTVGSVSKTEVAVAYLKDRVTPEFVQSVMRRLEQIDLEVVLESGFVEPFFESSRYSLFSGTGHTERPDAFCAKLVDGRIGILVDGTPFAILLPYLFTENFQTFDDYTNKPYYAIFVRLVKYVAFFVSIFFPGIYVGLTNYNPEIIPAGLLYNIATAQQSTPFPLMFEALFVHIMYEIVREAGLRLPRPVGHAVGLIGALVIGDAAVKAGIIGTPMIMTIAFTAISSFLIPQLYEPITILRFLCILIGGIFGPFGLVLAFCIILFSICSLNTYGVPYMAPISPYSKLLFQDGFTLLGWKRRAGSKSRLRDLPGSRIGGGRQDGA